MTYRNSATRGYVREDKKTTVEEIKGPLLGGSERFADQMTAAMNEAKAGSIIADSELPGQARELPPGDRPHGGDAEGAR